MPNAQPHILSQNGQRSLACSPVSVVVLVVDDDGRLLVGHHATRRRWEAVSGVLEAEESVLDAALRELAEEMGPAVRARPLGVLHASTFRYDDNAQFMISIVYLLAYQGGEVVPGDDMRGGGHRWVTVDEVESGRAQVAIPGDRWILRRAVAMHRLWIHEDVLLQKPLGDVR